MLGVTTQRIAAGLLSGAINAHTGRSLHVQQGQLDKACGLYCAAMGLALLKHLRDPIDLIRSKRSKVAVRLWEEYQPQYFAGASPEQLANIVSVAVPGLEVSWECGDSARFVKTVLSRIQEGNIAVLGWQSRDGRYDHWVLAIGLEEQLTGSSSRPTAVLCLDPSEGKPILSAYNARIELPAINHGKGGFLKFVTTGYETQVSLTEVVWLGAPA